MMLERIKYILYGPSCPLCGETKHTIPIIYGLVEYDEDDGRRKPRLIRQAEKGKVILGGCVVRPTSNSYYCKSCREGFGTEQSSVDVEDEF